MTSHEIPDYNSECDKPLSIYCIVLILVLLLKPPAENQPNHFQYLFDSNH